MDRRTTRLNRGETSSDRPCAAFVAACALGTSIVTASILLLADRISVATAAPPPVVAVYASRTSGEIEQVTVPGGVRTVVGSTGTSADSLIFEPSGDLIVTGLGSPNIYRIDPTLPGGASNVGTQVNTTPLSSSAADIALDAAGTNAYVTDFGHSVNVVDLGTGAVTIHALTGGLSEISGIAFDAAGQLWITDFSGNSVGIADLGADTYTPLCTGITSGSGGPDGLSFDPSSGLLYVSGQANDTITALTIGIGTCSIGTVYSVPIQPDGIAADGQGGVFAAGQGGTLARLDTMTAAVTNIATGIPSLDDLAPVFGQGAPSTTTSTTIVEATTTTTSVPVSTTTLPEHYQCYEVKPASFANRTVQAQDEFGTIGLPLRYPHRLCAAANKNGEGIGDPTENVTGYVTAAPFSKRLNQTIANQFGSIQLDLVRPDLFMVPTATDGVPINPPPGDHFTCYKVRPSRGAPKFTPVTVTVADQLETIGETLLKPIRFCAPANKNGEDPTAPAHPGHLLCYKSKSSAAFGTIVKSIDNQFGPDQMTLIHRRELCVPSLLNPGTTTTSTTTPSSTTSSTTTSSSSTSTTSSTTPSIPLDIIPDTAEKLPGGTQQFVVASGPPGPYTWSVNGVDGGDSTYGTIDSSGFYTAPAVVPVPATFDVCARVTATPAIFDCSTMTINPIPTPGEDVVVYNDINVLDDQSMVDPNNVLMLQNLLGYTTGGPRGTGTVVLVDGGHAPICGSAFCGSSFSTFAAQVAAAGFTMTIDTSGDLSTIAGNVKVMFLWLPTTFYSTAEINAMKQFAADGGRIVFIGEHSGFYGGGFPAQNDFLTKMGAVMTNVGNFIDCGYNTLPASSLRPHQITTGMTDVTMACSSEITLGPNDFALYYDSTNTHVLSGVAKIDTVPLLVTTAPAKQQGVSGWKPTQDAAGNPLP